MKRNRGWRRSQRARVIANRKDRSTSDTPNSGSSTGGGRLSKSHGKPPHRVGVTPGEKKWKLMYFRSRKMARARQLGFEYPWQPWRKWEDLYE